MIKTMSVGAALAALLGTGIATAAEPSIYLGASAGQSTVEEKFEGTNFKEDEDGYKIFAGARMGVLGVEGGYVNFGNPTAADVDVELDGWDLFATLNLDLGPAVLFAKAGAIWWDSDISVGGVSVSDDGSDMAYGVGASFLVHPNFSLRAEYERFDVGDVDDLHMYSIGAAFHF